MTNNNVNIKYVVIWQKYINIYNAYHMYVLNKLYVSFVFEELGKQAASVWVLYVWL